jgi:small neutral amino acid transporter SnatA (MarC family)
MTEQTPDPARARFFMLGFVRLGGVVLAFLGISIMAKHWVEPADIIGGALVVLGAIEVLVVPRILARKWRSQNL